MRNDFVFDWDAEYPDKVIETFRRQVKAALADLADHLEQLSDSFLLGQTAADFAQTVLVNFGTLQQVVTDQATQIADLETRVAALENPLPPAA